MSRPADDPPIPRDVLASMLERVVGRIRVGDLHDPNIVTTVRASEGEWRAILPGVCAKVLFDDGRTTTWLARMQAGSRIPAHDHDCDEEFLVLEGAMRIGDMPLGAGDYQHVRAGGHHPDCLSDAGCVVLLRSPSSLCAFARPS